MARELVNVDELHGQDLSQPRLVKDFLRLRLNASMEHEVCGLILLDSQHRLIDYLEPFRGTINQASVYPREIVKISLHHNALSIMLVHNHPSGLVIKHRRDWGEPTIARLKAEIASGNA